VCICIKKLIINAVGPPLAFNYNATMGNKIDHQQNKLNKNRIAYKYRFRQIREKGIMSIAIPKLFQLHILRHERATLIDSSTIVFGNECIRLVNIAFHASKMFPSIMGTCGTVSQYLQKELQQRVSKKHFHIIIGENNGFNFDISDYGHFADIKQEQYRVLIFSTKSHNKIKMDTHDVNNQMKLQWKSVVFKRIDN